MAVIILETASVRFDEIYQFTADRWGEAQAELYLTGLFEAIEGLADGRTRSRAVPASFGVQGFFIRYEHHFVYWRRLRDGDVGVVSILHERMHQERWLRAEFGDLK
ncbi:plasmid stabilization protein [Devosia insulae DS-56]|uniref:Plasmid stabilization protein n=1 Tax=Devosia insulae DS-56 TaxID=1116389 RepID=A0A1E5XT42_9HYPH|nr:type II toxin-antitoxin system RelE/ParE family toxin [Devosia insulae]OEO31782.1 plasmid stabilization protein [Devosia insulae DS-56]